ncbi:hypothetical protein [Streptomyces sp. NPDC058307]|uniref:hypothetical protein n=1 Tax=Streptomyces sp. NPDC058307 TaxID=3346439 RepID=UPI0036E4417F
MDLTYGASGWYRSDKPFLYGTPDVNKDGIPDIWSVRADGSVRFHAGGKTSVTDTGSEAVATNDYWQKRIAIG